MAQPIWMMLSGSVWRLIVSTCGPCAACQRQQKQPRSKVRSSSSSPPMIRHRLLVLSLFATHPFLPLLPFSSPVFHPTWFHLPLSKSFLLPRCPLCGNIFLFLFLFFVLSRRYDFKRTEKLIVWREEKETVALVWTPSCKILGRFQKEKNKTKNETPFHERQKRHTNLPRESSPGLAKENKHFRATISSRQ